MRALGNFQQIFMEGKMTEKKKNGGEVTHFCALCESRNAKKRCGGCRVRWYCSKECQTLHWKRGGHKRECQALLQSAAEEAQSDRLGNTQPWTTLCATILRCLRVFFMIYNGCVC